MPATKIRKCLKKLDLVNETLEKLGTSRKYRKIQNLIILMLLVYLLTALIIFTNDSIWNVEKHSTIKAMIIPLIIQYPFHVNALGDILFAFVLSWDNNFKHIC
ncbi:hypothetical protein PUN28_008292 [Cardiocondyla obscurior]|uniref:Uncharacterized protein n=1 Tax=Cardiocondyla obscurior TaxID=286306 RepID=A0AAW2G346_9HYME